VLSARAVARGLKRGLRAAYLLSLAPFAPLFRAAQGQRVLVLAYHDPDPSTLKAHFAALGRRYSIVPLSEAVSALESGETAGLPRRPLAITLDDGHAGNRALLDVARRFGVRPTVFACTGIGEQGFWWSGIAPLEQRRLKGVPDGERRAYVEARPSTTGVMRALDAAEILEMTADFDFEPHTRTHPVLPRCDDATAADEIAGSKRDLEQMLGSERDTFAYPNGEYSDRDIEAVRGAGYRCAFTTRPGFASSGDDMFRLPRVLVRDDAPVRELLVRASGLPGLLSRHVPRRLWSALQVR
jgi:peptidoglycan/xylan/chitin deacetylase (PgdA/CDA1 family)